MPQVKTKMAIQRQCNSMNSEMNEQNRESEEKTKNVCVFIYF